MTEIAVFDPPMCCSSGVCGPDADEALVKFAADLEWAGQNGAKVTRFNLGHEPGAFASNPLVRYLLESEGMGCLPLVVADNQVLTKGAYPGRDEFRARIAAGASALSEPAVSASACCGGGTSKASSCCS